MGVNLKNNFLLGKTIIYTFYRDTPRVVVKVSSHKGSILVKNVQTLLSLTTTIEVERKLETLHHRWCISRKDKYKGSKIIYIRSCINCWWNQANIFQLLHDGNNLQNKLSHTCRNQCIQHVIWIEEVWLTRV